jgi:hypothetical protein
MCTLSVVTRENAYDVAMNRDERITRGVASAPTRVALGATLAILPRDIAGGTWIATNEHGITLALLNWNEVPLDPAATVTARSRGLVIPELIPAPSRSRLHDLLHNLRLHDTLPFRMVGIFPLEREIWEWRWDTETLTSAVRGWQSRHWFSSSLSDAQARRFRAADCELARQEDDAGSLPWLRRLHSSHGQGGEAFSLCVHRSEVETVSYAEVACTPESVRFAYFAGNPCRMTQPPERVEIARAGQSASGFFPAA